MHQQDMCPQLPAGWLGGHGGATRSAASPRPARTGASAPFRASMRRHSPGENGGSSVPARARPASLAGIGSAATRQSHGTQGDPRGDCTGTGTWGRQGPAAPAAARRAASLRKPARSQGKCWGDAQGQTTTTHRPQLRAAPPNRG